MFLGSPSLTLSFPSNDVLLADILFLSGILLSDDVILLADIVLLAALSPPPILLQLRSAFMQRRGSWGRLLELLYCSCRVCTVIREDFFLLLHTRCSQQGRDRNQMFTQRFSHIIAYSYMHNTHFFGYIFACWRRGACETRSWYVLGNEKALLIKDSIKKML